MGGYRGSIFPQRYQASKQSGGWPQAPKIDAFDITRQNSWFVLAADMEMSHRVLWFPALIISTLMCPGLGQGCEEVSPEILRECSDIGYNFTTRLHDARGQDYQKFIRPRISLLKKLLGNCSAYSVFIICSRYIPQCTDGLRPQPPCRDVCEQFVADCSSRLEDGDAKRLYTALCDLLPEPDPRDRTSCIRPKGFSPRTSTRTKKRGASIVSVRFQSGGSARRAETQFAWSWVLG